MWRWRFCMMVSEKWGRHSLCTWSLMRTWWQRQRWKLSQISISFNCQMFNYLAIILQGNSNLFNINILLIALPCQSTDEQSHNIYWGDQQHGGCHLSLGAQSGFSPALWWHRQDQRHSPCGWIPCYLCHCMSHLIINWPINTQWHIFLVIYSANDSFWSFLSHKRSFKQVNTVNETVFNRCAYFAQ